MEPLAHASIPELGSLVGGRYRIGRTIGEGGMGVVLAARDERTGDDVAIKILQVLGASNTERFLREARLAAKIESEHVVRVLDTGALEDHPFLVMERLHGEDYGAKIRNGGLPLVEVADCIVQTCEALARAHNAGVIHRDIKASNLFEHVEADGRRIVKVLDFGISKTLSAENPGERTLTRTRDGGFLGSPPYMSPEHIRDPRNVDGRADLWSLGVVAYRLLSTEYPFDGESTGEVLVAILERAPKPLRELGIHVPEEVERIVRRCLARDRDARFADAGELATAFAPFASPALRGYGAKVTSIAALGPRRAAPAAHAPASFDPSTRTVPPPKAGDPATATVPPFGAERSPADEPTTTPSNPFSLELPVLTPGEPMPSTTKILATTPIRPPFPAPAPSTPGPALSPSPPSPSSSTSAPIPASLTAPPVASGASAADVLVVTPRPPRRAALVAGGFVGALAVGLLLVLSAARMRSSVTIEPAPSPSASPGALPASNPTSPPSGGPPEGMSSSAGTGSSPGAAASTPSTPVPGASGPPPKPFRPKPRPRAPATAEPKPAPPPPAPPKKPELQPNPYPDL